MKICAHCTTENRDQAIFCRRCRRALGTSITSENRPSRNALMWFLGFFFLLGLSRYLFSPGPVGGSTVIQSPTSFEDTIQTAAPAATRTEEPITISGCVRDSTRIRRGPGTQYETTGGLVSGTCLMIIGRDDAASWVYIVSEDHQTGWMDTSLLNDTWGLSKVSVREAAGMPNASRATLTNAEVAYGAQAYLTQVVATNIPQSSFTRHLVPCFDTAKMVGEHVSCKMGKAVCDYLPAKAGSLTVCNDRPYPDHNFALIVYGEDWSDFDSQCIIISGHLEINKGVLQIEASGRSQVSHCK